MRVAVTGTRGRVGAALARHFALRHEVIPLPRQVCDLADPASLAAALDRLQCDLLLNPAGITSLEDCEDDPTLAMRVNAEAPGEIAAWAASRGVPVFHFSTDYVFSGKTAGLCHENDVSGPLNAYGRSKLAGENAVLSWPGNCVVRVSWVFGPDKPSFVDAIYDAALVSRPLAAVADKFSLPAYTPDLSQWTERLVELKTTGIIHACNSGDPVSWHDMATAVVEEMVACGTMSSIPAIRPQRLDEMTAFRATRPRFTAMDTRRLTEILGHPPRPWREALIEHVRWRGSFR
ncbi:MAG: NAD(P)-dependent oxidoreductase [Verrucomicrobiota bacterium]